MLIPDNTIPTGQEAVIAATVVKDAADHASEVTAKAVEIAENLVIKAKENASNLLGSDHEEMDRRMTRNLSEALRRVFGENEASQRFIDTSRIPLICKDISGIKDTLDEIKDTLNDKFVSNDVFNPYRKSLNVVAVALLLALVAALTALIFKK